MPLSLEIGTIDIADRDVARYVESKSVEDIKAMFVSLLTSRARSRAPQETLDDRLRDLRIVDPDKTRRVKTALDSLNHKLSGLHDTDIQAEKDRYIQEKFHA